MSPYVFAIALTIAANVGYHLCQRTIRPDLNPWASLLATYATALVLTLLAWPLLAKDAQLGAELRKLTWPSFALGLAIVGLELGFLLAYRAGWQLSVAALYSNAAVAILLLPIGVLAFKEILDVRTSLGLGLALLGLWLLSTRPAAGLDPGPGPG